MYQLSYMYTCIQAMTTNTKQFVSSLKQQKYRKHKKHCSITETDTVVYVNILLYVTHNYEAVGQIDKYRCLKGPSQNAYIL